MQTAAVQTRADDHGVAVAHAGTGDVCVTRGLTLSFEAFEAFSREYEAFARERDISVAALERFFATLVIERVPLEEVESRLDEIADAFLRARADMRRFRPRGDAAGLQEKAERALEAGRIDEAEALLIEVQTSMSKNADAAQQAAREAMRADAEAAALRGNLRLVKLDYPAAAAALREAVDKLPEQDPLKAEYLTRLSDAERQAGRFLEAREAADAALGSARDGNSELAIKALRAQALASREMGEYADAERALWQALEVMEGADLADTLKAALTLERSWLLLDRGFLDEAADALSTDVALSNDETSSATLPRARQCEALGRLRKERGEWAEAKEALERAFELKAQALPKGHPGQMRTMADLAFACQKLGLYTEAADLYATAFEGLERVLGANHPDLVTMLDHMGGLHAERGELARAEDYYRRAIALAQETLGPDHPDLAQSWNNLGTVLLDHGDARGASRSFDTAIRIFEHALGAAHPDTATALHNLAAALFKQGDVQGAAQKCDDALRRRTEVFGAASPVTADTYLLRANLHHHLGRGADAIADQRTALTVFETTYGPADHRTARTLADLARFHLELAEVQAALSPARRSLLGLLAAKEPNCQLVVLALNNLGHALTASGRPRRAAVLLGWVLDHQRRSGEGETERLVMALVNLAAALGAGGRAEAANELHLETLEIGARLWPGGHLLTAAAMNNIAKFHESNRDIDEARRLFASAHGMMVRALGEDHPHARAVERNLKRIERYPGDPAP